MTCGFVGSRRDGIKVRKNASPLVYWFGGGAFHQETFVLRSKTFRTSSMYINVISYRYRIMTERKVNTIPGVAALVIHLIFWLLPVWMAPLYRDESSPVLIVGMILWVFSLISAAGFFVVEPNGSKVLILFGRYIGTVTESGFHWANPFAVKRNLSRRIRNLNGERLKVNDALGNPVEIAAVISWQVVDSAKASFEVDDYEDFVRLQTETALRHSASTYPYDADDESSPCLRRNAEDVSEHLKQELATAVAVAGVQILDARLSHLAYAQEIAGAMLRRQQAAAVLSARAKIVDGAVGMVEMALQRIENEGVIKLDEERKAAMVSNLMVVLCSDHAAQPVVNTGSLY